MASLTSFLVACHLLLAVAMVTPTGAQVSTFSIYANTQVSSHIEAYSGLNKLQCARMCVKGVANTACVSTEYDVTTRTCYVGTDFKGSLTYNEHTSSMSMLLKDPCGDLEAPTDGSVKVGQSLTVYSCRRLYNLVGNKERQCWNGSWTGEMPSCEPACPMNIEEENANVDVIYPPELYDGHTVITTCKNGFRSDKGAEFWITCRDRLGWLYKAGMNIPGGYEVKEGYRPDCIWELMFRGTAANGVNVTEAFLTGDVSSGVTSDDPICMNIYNTSCALHYRNPKIDDWQNISEVAYELYDNRNKVVTLVFNTTTGTSASSWFVGNMVNYKHPWTSTDLSTSTWQMSEGAGQGQYFRIQGPEITLPCTDILYTAVLFDPINPCSYEIFESYPQFTYTTSSVGSVYELNGFDVATTMGIWVKNG